MSVSLSLSLSLSLLQPALPASQLQALVEQCRREQSQQNSIAQDHSCSQTEDGAELPQVEAETMTL